MSEYLAIKNWKKYQSLRGGGKWIKDYTGQTDDEDMAKLSLFQRMVLQGIRRLCGKLGRNVPNDAHYICNEMNALRTDRPRVKDAIDTLIEQQWLSVMGSSELPSEQPGELEKREENRERTKPTAKAAPRGDGRPTDPRFPHCVEILHRYWAKFIQGKVKFEIWMDRAGYKQLKNSLKRSEALSVEDFTRCVANRARSPGVNHCEPAYKWLGHVTDWAGGQKNGAGTSKAEQRVADMAETTRAVFSGSGSVLGDGATGVPDATSGRGAGDVAGNAQRLLTRGAAAGGGSPGN